MIFVNIFSYLANQWLIHGNKGIWLPKAKEELQEKMEHQAQRIGVTTAAALNCRLAGSYKL